MDFERFGVQSQEWSLMKIDALSLAWKNGVILLARLYSSPPSCVQCSELQMGFQGTLRAIIHRSVNLQRNLAVSLSFKKPDVMFITIDKTQIFTAPEKLFCIEGKWSLRVRGAVGTYIDKITILEISKTIWEDWGGVQKCIKIHEEWFLIFILAP